MTKLAPAEPRLRPATLWAAAAGIAGAAALLGVALTALRPALPSVLPGYPAWLAGYGHPGPFLRWVIGDTTEAEYFKTAIAGAAMLLGAALAHWAYRRGRRWRGFDVSYGTGLWPWLAASAMLGLVLSNLVWGWTVPATGSWQPTFVPFVSVPPAVVLVYGRGWAVTLTGALLGAALTTPVALVVVNFVCNPLGLPGVVGTTTGMWAGALIAFALCRVLPWMPAPLTVATPETDTPDAKAPVRQGPAWVARRVLADFTEAQFYGNEWASAGLIGGTLLTYLLNPMLPAGGSGLLPQVLTAQVLTAAIGVVLWRRQWAGAGWYPTFVPVVSVAPATVLAFNGTIQAVVAGAVLGALAGPPLAAAVARRLPAHFHPFIGNVVSMTVCTAVIVPALSVLPGFHG
ncbi:MAG: putative rane protein [Streptosporangiaceae bacterium]|nr:putative rane protein [Streptosporangiaceae bacterium]